MFFGHEVRWWMGEKICRKNKGGLVSSTKNDRRMYSEFVNSIRGAEGMSSAKVIDYRELEQLLKNKEWRKADELTAKLMLKVANREKEGWLDHERIKAFPCEDLRTIDQLWVNYSNSKFGFSIQKKLWLEYGGEIGRYDYEVFKKFAAKIGWYHPQNNDWRTYAEFMNDTENTRNAMPASLPLMGGYHGGGCFVVSNGWFWSLLSLLSRKEL